MLECAPHLTLQWLAPVSLSNRRIQTWLLDNMNIWVKKLLVFNKQTNVRYNAAILLVNLVPNRAFRETFTSNRNMLVPFKPPRSTNGISPNSSPLPDSSTNLSQYTSLEMNYDFNSRECKQVLHQIIKFLFSFIDDISKFLHQAHVDAKNLNASKVGGNDADNSTPIGDATNKSIGSTYNQSIDKFWKLYYPHIANNHVYTNLNKQLAVHFFYQTLLNCQDNLDYLLTHNIESIPYTSSNQEAKTRLKVTFTNRILRELPVCTVAVDHDDCDLITYNRQCLHPYYATIRLLCERSPAYCREMTNPQYFQWAFKHILPYSIQYPSAVQELNKCLELFLSRGTFTFANVSSTQSQVKNKGDGVKNEETVQEKKKSENDRGGVDSANEEELIVDDLSETENKVSNEKKVNTF